MNPEDVGRAVKVGLTVYDSDLSEVGFVDQVDKGRGWMLVRAVAVDRTKLWIPYMLVKSWDHRGLFVSGFKATLEVRYRASPPRTTKIEVIGERTMATTSEPSGYDGEPAVTSQVDPAEVRQRLAVGQQVWTADDAAYGSIASFDRDGRYAVVKHGSVSREKYLLISIALIADVDREAGEVTLAVFAEDLDRLKRPEVADFVIELQSPLDH